MDNLDLTLKFSSELLVIGLAILVGVLNIVFFKFGTGKAYSDNSHAFKLLSYHTNLNAKYYGKETSISTVMVSKAGFIAQAQADDFEGLSNHAILTNEESVLESSITQNETFEQPSPDSVRELIAKQIKVYETKEGDTLRNIAAMHDITLQTLIDANNLRNDTVVKPGWKLVILPTDGVLYKATSNDTLPDVAKKFSGNLDTIISYNGLENAEDIEAGQLIIIPGGHMPLPVKPKTTKPKTPSKAIDKSKIGGDAPVQKVEIEKLYDDADAHIFPKGYCTWYVAQKVYVPWGGNAKNWPANARGHGAVIDKDPSPGAILVTNDNARYGHVAYIEKVTETTITVSEMNYERFGKVNWREIPRNSSTIKAVVHP